MNNDGIGVFSLSGTSNWVKRCIFDKGDIGIPFSQDSCSRAEDNILENQTASEEFEQGSGWASIRSPGASIPEDAFRARRCTLRLGERLYLQLPFLTFKSGFPR
jgi:hypothetical protein